MKVAHWRLTAALVTLPVMLVGIVGAAPAAMANGSAPTDIAVSANPPASTPSMSVTYTATVSDPSDTTPPTGTVDFTYKVTGGGVGGNTYDLGTVALQPSGPASSVATVTITPDAPPVTVNGGNPLPNGVITVTGSYSGDANFAANSSATNEITRANCDVGPWPTAVNGYPHAVIGGPEGYYIGEVGGYWSIYDAHPEDGTTVKFTGTLKTDGNGEFLDVNPTKNETGDTVRLDGQSEITFKFLTHESLDGFTFFAGCASKVTFTLDADMIAVPHSEIYLGNPTTHPPAGALKFKRSS
jgi:hypothetical protein